MIMHNEGWLLLTCIGDCVATNSCLPKSIERRYGVVYMLLVNDEEMRNTSGEATRSGSDLIIELS